MRDRAVAPYRAVQPREWTDSKVLSLSIDATLVYFYALCGPCSTRMPGILRLPLPDLVYRFGWDFERARALLREICDKGLARYDEPSAFLWLFRPLANDPPDNPNIVLSWARVWNEITDSEAKQAAAITFLEALEPLGAQFVVAFRKMAGLLPRGPTNGQGQRVPPAAGATDRTSAPTTPSNPTELDGSGSSGNSSHAGDALGKPLPNLGHTSAIPLPNTGQTSGIPPPYLCQTPVKPLPNLGQTSAKPLPNPDPDPDPDPDPESSFDVTAETGRETLETGSSPTTRETTTKTTNGSHGTDKWAGLRPPEHVSAIAAVFDKHALLVEAGVQGMELAMTLESWANGLGTPQPLRIVAAEEAIARLEASCTATSSSIEPRARSRWMGKTIRGLLADRRKLESCLSASADKAREIDRAVKLEREAKAREEAWEKQKREESDWYNANRDTISRQVAGIGGRRPEWEQPARAQANGWSSSGGGAELPSSHEDASTPIAAAGGGSGKP